MANDMGKIDNGWLNTGAGNGIDADTLDGYEWAAIEENLRGKSNLHGFPFPYKVDLQYHSSTRTISLTPSDLTFDIWISGTRITKNGIQVSPPHDDISGSYFFTYNDDGSIKVKSVVWDLLDPTETPICMVYYNADLNDGIALFELHTSTRNLNAHAQQHFSLGTFVRSSSNFALSNYTINGTTTPSVTFSVSSGDIVDEDITFSINSLPVGGPYTIVYRTGVASWAWITNSEVPYRVNTATDSIQRNPFIGGAYELQDLGNNNYVNYFLVATTAIDSAKRLFLIPSQSEQTTLTNAQSEGIESLNLSELPIAEFVPIWKITYRKVSSQSTPGKARLIEVSRLSSTRQSSVSLAGVGSSHNSLTGRSDADSHPASAISTVPTSTLTSSTVQTALNEIDSKKAPLIPLSDNNIDLGTNALAFRNLYAHKLVAVDSIVELGVDGWQITLESNLLKCGPVGNLETLATRLWSSSVFALGFHSHSIADITDLQTALDGKASITHDHDTAYLKLSGGNITGSIVPYTHNSIDLGTNLMRFRSIWAEEIHVSGNSLYLGDTKILGTEASTVVIKTDIGQDLKISTNTAAISLLTLGANSNINLTAGGNGSRIQITSNDSEVNISAVQTTFTGDVTTEDNCTISGNLTVIGNLTVSGDNFSVNVQTVNIEDSIAVVNYGEVGSGVTNRYSGIQVDRGVLTDAQLVYDEFDDFFKIGLVGNLEVIASREWCNLQFSTVVHSHAISEISNLQTTLDGKASSIHNHDSAYLSLSGGSLSGAVTFSSPRLKYGNYLAVNGLVIDSTKWYRVLSLDGNYCPNIEMLIQIPLGHSSYRVRVSKGTSGNGMGWTAEVDCLGIYNYSTGNIIAARVVDMGTNGATYVDVKFNGNATRDVRLSIVSEISNTAGNYATLIACTDQGTATAGVVSQLGFFDNATTVGVSKSYLNPWGILSIQHDSASLRHRYQVGTIDYVVGINSVGGSLQTRSAHPLNFYTNTVKRIEIAATDATTITLNGNANSDNVSLVFARVGVSPIYSQTIKFSYNSISQSVTDTPIPGQINSGLVLGYNDGSTVSNALVIGNGQVAINGAAIVSGNAFQVNGNAYTAGIHTVKNLSFWGLSGDSGEAAKDYGIYQAGGAWTSPYPDLCIAYHTGIRIGAAAIYGGTRFYGNSFANGSGNEPYLMGVGDGANDVYFPTSIRFGTTTRQMMNLWSTSFGIGVQSGTLYFRTGNTAAHFSFHAGGVHSDAACAPGAGGVEYMRLNNYGLYLDPSNALGGSAWYRSYGNTGWYSETYGGGIYMTDTTWVRTYNSKGLAGYYLNGSTLAGTGNRAVYSDASGTLTNTASDERLKTSILPLSYGLDEVMRMIPVKFKWKDSTKMGSQKEIGLLAQEIHQIVPEVVGYNNDGMMSLDYPKLIAVLINAIKELKGEIDELSRRRDAGI